jgi:hypothetical protein
MTRHEVTRVQDVVRSATGSFEDDCDGDGHAGYSALAYRTVAKHSTPAKVPMPAIRSDVGAR